MDNKKVALLFKAFCDENRIQILQLLQNGERCACKLLEALQITQPTLSHHMKILCDAGVVVGRKDGKWMYYSISEEGLEQAMEYIQVLKEYVREAGDQCESCRESKTVLR